MRSILQNLVRKTKKRKEENFIIVIYLKGSQLSFEQQNRSRWTIITLVICSLVLFTMAAFALLYFIKRNDRIRNKLAEITHIKGLSTNYYQVKFIYIKRKEKIWVFFCKGFMSTKNASTTNR
jgi:hypothetical protein